MEDIKFENQQIMTTSFEEKWFWFGKNIVTKDQVNRIHEVALEYTVSQGQTDGDTVYTRQEVRDCKLSWLDDEEIYEIVRPIVQDVNEYVGWNYELTAIEPAQYTIYTSQNNHYSWHVDCSSSYNQQEGILKNTVRKISCVIQLSDENDYEGGDFQFSGLDNTSYIDNKQDHLESKTLEIPDAKGLGNVVMFPSFTFHRVLPVTRGIRKTLVVWFRGPKWR